MKRATLICPTMGKGQVFLLMTKFTYILLFATTTAASASLPSNKSTSSQKPNIQQQQDIEITGQVTDASIGEALPGVNIVVDGTSIGVISDQDGNYSITVPDENPVLVFSYVGYTTKSETVGSRSVINISLEPEAQDIEEVIAIGYGTIKKFDLTGAVSTVKADDFIKTAPVNVQSAIQGRAAGVYVSRNSGAPGKEPAIRIRGVGSIHAHGPIYVIDGMIMDPNDSRNVATTTNFLNPADIASIEVLKDASATAIYGSRGANGVILISTRKGFNSDPKVSFRAELGFTKLDKLDERLGPDEYLEYIRTAYGNGLHTTQPDTLPEVEMVIQDYDRGYVTDWQQEIFKDGPALSQDYHLSVKGGTPKAAYATSFGYYNEEGTAITNSNYARYSFRINSNYKLGRHIKIGENLGISQTNILGVQQSSRSAFFWAANTAPIYPVYKSDTLDPGDPFYISREDPNFEYNKFAGAPNDNPVASLYHNYNTQSRTLSILGNVYAEATFLKDFRLRSSLGLNRSTSHMDDFDPEYFITSTNQSPSSTVYKWLDWTQGWLWENTLTYEKEAGKHHITLLAGYTSEHNRYEYLHAKNFNTPSNQETMQTFNSATSTPILNGSYDIVSMLSMLGRLNYSFGNRYLLTASIRKDGSSKFGPGHKWGLFPSAALGWIISNENFFEQLKSQTIPLLKIRAGWGRIGNSSMSSINTNTYVTQYASKLSLRALFNGQVHQGYGMTVIGIPDLTWETMEQLNLGLNLALFDQALTLDADYFIKTTHNMLVQANVPDYSGYGMLNDPWINAGTMENKGFEWLIRYKGNAGKFLYDLSVNGSTYKNVVLSTNADSTDIWDPMVSSLTKVGYPVGSYYGYVTDGIFQNTVEVLSYSDSLGNPIQQHALPGDFRFKDLDQNGQLTAADRCILGDPHPDFIFGFTLNLAWAGFDFLTHWQGVYGNELWNSFRNDMTGGGNPDRKRYLDAWRGEDSSYKQPRITRHDLNYNFRDSDFYIEDGSYLRMKYIQLGYTLPVQLSQKMHIASLRIWMGGTDLLTFTNYTGYDPEVALVDPMYSGHDQGKAYPRSRKISLGINIDF
ncbi:MAG: TonB-dependent receptor [Bacteroidota bacterium]